MELTPELITLLIDRLFAPEERETAAGLLAEYGEQPHEREPFRVQVAILKVSEGNPERLRELVAEAHHDYRDVLAFARNIPRRSRAPPGACRKKSKPAFGPPIANSTRRG